MNLLKTQDALKSASDQQLVQEMQNPTGIAPQFLVLSELERRKKIRDSTPVQAPQGTVADETLGAAQGGIGGFAEQGGQPPVQDAGIGSLMQDEPQGMKAGGPVRGFQAGGSIGPNESDEALIRRLLAEGTRLPTLERRYGLQTPPISAVNPSRIPLEIPLPPGPISDIESPLSGPSEPPSFDRPARTQWGGPRNDGPRPSGERVPLSVDPMVPDASPISPFLAQRFTEDGRMLPPPAEGTRLPVTPTDPSVQTGEMQGQPIRVGQTQGPPAPSGPPQPQPQTPPPQPGDSNYGIAGLPGARGGGGNGGGRNSGAPPVLAEALRGASTDPSARPDIMNRVQFEDRLTPFLNSQQSVDGRARSNEALDMALISAGLRIAGSQSPHFAAALAEGATPAIQDYTNQRREIRSDQRADRAEGLAIANAQTSNDYRRGQLGATLAQIEAAERNSLRDNQTRLEAARIQASTAGAGAGAAASAQQRLIEWIGADPTRMATYQAMHGRDRADVAGIAPALNVLRQDIGALETRLEFPAPRNATPEVLAQRQGWENQLRDLRARYSTGMERLMGDQRGAGGARPTAADPLELRR